MPPHSHREPPVPSSWGTGHPQAYFRTPDQRAWAERWGIGRTPQGALDYGEFVWSARAAGRTGNGVFGARLMWGTHAELADRPGELHPELAGNELRPLEREFGQRIRYDRDALTRDALGHLGLALPDSQAITPSRQRQADRLDEEWVARYRSKSRAVSPSSSSSIVPSPSSPYSPPTPHA